MHKWGIKMSRIPVIKAHIDGEVTKLNKAYQNLCAEENRSILRYQDCLEAIYNLKVSLTTMDRMMEAEIVELIKETRKNAGLN